VSVSERKSYRVVRKKRTHPEQDRLRVVGYARVSTEEQAQQGVSLSAQRERIEAFCTARNWELRRIYTDVASGKDLRRPGLQQLLADGRRGLFEAVVFTKLDRLSRRVLDWGRLQEEMRRLEIGLVSIAEGLDDTTPMGRAMANIVATFAQLEREVIGERTAAALRYKRDRLEVYGPTPYGFKRVGDRLLPNARELAVVEDIFARRERGASLREIAAALAQRGVPSPTGRPEWSAEAIRKLLRNAPLYGKVINGLLDRTTGQRRARSGL